ncbi:MAG: hypothetical protein ABSD10_04200 [Candidatus Saccharimonadales bacterium]|jgi:uncharacterized membrane protein YeiB
MKRFPDILMIVAVLSGVVYLLEQNAASSIIRLIALVLLITSLVVSIVYFLIDQERKTKS